MEFSIMTSERCIGNSYSLKFTKIYFSLFVVFNSNVEQNTFNVKEKLLRKISIACNISFNFFLSLSITYQSRTWCVNN